MKIAYNLSAICVPKKTLREYTRQLVWGGDAGDGGVAVGLQHSAIDMQASTESEQGGRPSAV